MTAEIAAVSAVELPFIPDPIGSTVTASSSANHDSGLGGLSGIIADTKRMTPANQWPGGCTIGVGCADREFVDRPFDTPWRGGDGAKRERLEFPMECGIDEVSRAVGRTGNAKLRAGVFRGTDGCCVKCDRTRINLSLVLRPLTVLSGPDGQQPFIGEVMPAARQQFRFCRDPFPPPRRTPRVGGQP